MAGGCLQPPARLPPAPPEPPVGTAFTSYILRATLRQVLEPEGLSDNAFLGQNVRPATGRYLSSRPVVRRLQPHPPDPTGGAVAQLGRAPDWQSGGRGFDPHQLHHFNFP